MDRRVVELLVFVTILLIICVMLLAIPQRSEGEMFAQDFAAPSGHVPDSVEIRWRPEPKSISEIMSRDWQTLDVGHPVPVPRCYRANVDIPGPGYTELRFRMDGRVSPWSNAKPVPEPAPRILLGVGLLGLALLTRRRLA